MISLKEKAWNLTSSSVSPYLVYNLASVPVLMQVNDEIYNGTWVHIVSGIKNQIKEHLTTKIFF